MHFHQVYCILVCFSPGALWACRLYVSWAVHGLSRRAIPSPAMGLVTASDNFARACLCAYVRVFVCVQLFFFMAANTTKGKRGVAKKRVMKMPVRSCCKKKKRRQDVLKPMSRLNFQGGRVVVGVYSYDTMRQRTSYILKLDLENIVWAAQRERERQGREACVWGGEGYTHDKRMP